VWLYRSYQAPCSEEEMSSMHSWFTSGDHYWLAVKVQCFQWMMVQPVIYLYVAADLESRARREPA
ncbi:hypothetical protein, partial [Erythrobacter sp. YJ-T3-07]|uniref:hypothetical protein n=1 Tax=Erythrobacter sp. YJ-T3-07 TaxID=2793063 RepID=UPI001F29AB3B